MRYTQRPCAALGVCALVIYLTAVPAAALTGPPAWKTPEEVSTDADYLNHLGSDRALACDHWGNAGVAYRARVDQSLQYAQKLPGFGWTSWTVDDSTDTGLYPSLAFDRYERPAISYTTAGNDLWYAHFDGSSWQTQQVDPTDGSHSSLAFDIYGNPAIAYNHPVNGLKIAYDNDGNGTFTVTNIPGQLEHGHLPSLAFDSLNRPLIAHFNDENDDLLLTTFGPGGWVTARIDDSTQYQNSCSLAIEPGTNHPAVAYTDDNWDLIYVEWDGAAWDKTVVDDYYGANVSLAFDPSDGEPAVAYDDQIHKDLFFAWRTGGVWNAPMEVPLPISVQTGTMPSLAFNEYGDGWPIIAFMSVVPQELYVIEDPPVPEPATLSLLAIGAAALLRRRRQRAA